MVRANWGPNWRLEPVNTNWSPGPVNTDWGPGSGKHKDPAFLLLLIICFCYTVNYNTQWAFVIKAWHYSHNNRIGKKSVNAIFIKKFLTESNHFLLFWCIPCTATPETSSSSENINNTARVSRLSFRFLWIWYNFLYYQTTPFERKDLNG